MAEKKISIKIIRNISPVETSPASEPPNEAVGLMESPMISRYTLTRILECPICMDTLNSPVRMCSNGHSVCDSCFRSVNQCGLCREIFTTTRNFLAEAILDNVTLPCSYTRDGCTEIFSGANRKLHEDKCCYRPIICTLQNEVKRCNSVAIDFSNYERHLLEGHGLPCMSDEKDPESKFRIHFYDKDIFCSREGYWPWIYFHFDGQTFVIRSYLANGIFSTWCCILGLESLAEKYTISLSLLSHGSRHYPKSGQCECPCCTEPEDITNICESWSGLPIHSQYIQTFQELETNGNPFCVKIDTLPCYNQKTKKRKMSMDHDSHNVSSRKVRLLGSYVGKVASSKTRMFSWSFIYQCFQKPENILV